MEDLVNSDCWTGAWRAAIVGVAKWDIGDWFLTHLKVKGKSSVRIQATLEPMDCQSMELPEQANDVTFSLSKDLWPGSAESLHCRHSLQLNTEFIWDASTSLPCDS